MHIKKIVNRNEIEIILVLYFSNITINFVYRNKLHNIIYNGNMYFHLKHSKIFI